MCQACAAGQYGDELHYGQDDPRNGTFTACKTCAVGQFSADNAAHACRNVTLCAPGAHEVARPPADRSADRTCNPCAVNTFAPLAGTVNCTACGADEWTSGMRGQSQCVARPTPAPTPAPTPSPTPAPTPAPTPQCQPGTYQYVTDNVSGCAKCAPGRFTDNINMANCTDCPAGTFFDDEVDGTMGAGVCVRCAAGLHQPAAGQLFCKGCAAGKFHVGTVPASASSVEACQACYPGRFQEMNGIDLAPVQRGVCRPKSPCPVGEGEVPDSAANLTADRTCEVCRAGTFSADAHAPCAPVTRCTVDEWESEPPTTSSDRGCSTHLPKCPDGQFTSAAPTNFSDRVCRAFSSCPAGKYVAVSGTSDNDRQCNSCQSGHYNYQDNQDTCSACPAGQFRTDAPASSE